MAAHAGEQAVHLHVALREDVRVGGVERDPGPRVLPDPPGQAVVVGMDVGDEHREHVADLVAGLAQAGVERVPGILGVPAGVDHRDAVVALEQVHEDVAQRALRHRDGHRPQARAQALDRGQDVVVPGLLLQGPADIDRCKIGVHATPLVGTNSVNRRPAHANDPATAPR